MIKIKMPYWLREADVSLKQAIVCLALSLGLVLFVALPLKNGAMQKRGELGKQRQKTAKYLEVERALLDQEKVVSPAAPSLSVVGFLEQVTAQLRLEKKLLRVTPNDSGVQFEMKGLNLEEVAALLAQVEQTDAVAIFTFLQLTPETEKASQFYLQAKLEKF